MKLLFINNIKETNIYFKIEKGHWSCSISHVLHKGDSSMRSSHFSRTWSLSRFVLFIFILCFLKETHFQIVFNMTENFLS